MYSHGPKTVTDGLTFCLDAASPRSYPREGNQWYDLTQRNWPTTISGTVFYSGTYGGGIDFPNASTAQYAVLPVQALNRLTSDFRWTLEFWVKNTRFNTDVGHISSVAKATNTNTFICRHQNDGQFNVWQDPGGVRPIINGAYPTIPQGALFAGTITNSPVDCRIYINGNLTTVVQPFTGVSTATAWVLNQDQDTVSGSFSSTQCYLGTFFRTALFDRTLSAAEVQQNYNAFKGRFGK